VFGQPQTWQEQWAHATALRDHRGVTFEVAVGDIAGTRRCALVPKPNSVYLRQIPVERGTCSIRAGSFRPSMTS
jgi:hypothetical protein